MDNTADSTSKAVDSGLLPEGIQSAVAMTPLQLNAVKLDVRHTLLTPQLLEGMEEG